MKQNIKSISFKKPCHENWDSMTNILNGKFCDNCQKSVIDFSGLSNKQILTIISDQHQLCGKFENSQLINFNQYLLEENVNRFSWKKLGFATAIVGFMPFLKVEAQVKSLPELHHVKSNRIESKSDTTSKQSKKISEIRGLSYTAKDIQIDTNLSTPNITNINLQDQTITASIGGLVVRRSLFYSMLYAIKQPFNTIFGH